MIPVSVVVPCYRCAGTIERAVASVAAQTQPPGEVLLVDDGSGDCTLDVLRGLAARFESIRVVALDENRGAATARNAGWEEAKGEFIAFLDADDTWHPRKLEIQYAFMREHPEFHLSGHLHGFGGEFPLVADSPAWREMGFGDLLWRNRFVTPSVMLRRSMPERFLDGQRAMEDHLLWMKAAAAGRRIALIEATLCDLHKPQYGAGGVSGNLAATERAELGNYVLLYREGAIGLVRLILLILWSLAKFARRLLVVAFR